MVNLLIAILILAVFGIAVGAALVLFLDYDLWL
jgi:hypothetical protein